MACVAIAYIVLQRGRTFGVAADPRSILGIASLSLNPHITAIMRRISLGSDGAFSAVQAAGTLGERNSKFGYIACPSGEQEYGIIVIDDVAEVQSLTSLKPEVRDPAQVSDPPPLEVGRGTPKRSVGVWILVKVIGFAILILGLMIPILYYLGLPTKTVDFERFMDSQSTF